MNPVRSAAACAVACATLAIGVRADVSGRAAQQPAQRPADTPRGTGLLLGHVVAGDPPRPVSGVMVVLSGSALSSSSGERIRVPEQRVLTDASGAFIFSALPAGDFSIEATRTGYANGAFGRRRPDGGTMSLSLSDRERRGDVTIPVWKLGALGGLVLDEAGEPVVGVMVKSYLRRPIGGRARFTADGSAVTDDRGAYRIANLLPGDYVVAVPSIQTTLPASILDPGFDRKSIPPDVGSQLFSLVSSAGAPGTPRAMRVGDSIVQVGPQAPIPPDRRSDGSLAVYATRFHPAAASMSQASVIHLLSGEQRAGIDVQLRAVPAVLVSGTVTGLNAPVAAQLLRLVPQGEISDTPMGAAAALTDSRGAFTFVGVPAGQYTIRAAFIPKALVGAAGSPPRVPTEPAWWADVPVSVSDRDVSVPIPLSPGARIGGHVEYQGAAARSAQALVRVPVMIEAADTLNSVSVPNLGVASDGTFTTYSLPPGHYFVRLGSAPPGWTFKGATLDGKDVTDTPLELGSTDITNVVLTFTDHPSSLNVSVTDHENRPDASADVLIFPTDPATWIDSGLNVRRLLGRRTGADGTYTFSNLPAGDYFVVAIPDELSEGWKDPVVLS